MGVNAVHELRTLLVPFIRKRVDTQDLEDVLQTVFVRIQSGLAELRDTDKLVPWAYQIARNAIVDHARRVESRRHEPLDRLPSVVVEAGAEEDSGSDELARILGHFVAMLPEPYREALRLTELEGVTQADAARRAGISVPGMKSRVQRARVQLRGLLEACCDIALDTRGGIIDVEPRNRPPELPDCCARNLHPSSSRSVSGDMTNKPATNQDPVNTRSEPAVACCGGPAPADTDACCVQDAAAKAAGETGCGCRPQTASKRACC